MRIPQTYAILSVLLIPLTFACRAPANDPRDARDARDPRDARTRVAETLDDFHDAAGRADEQRYFAHFAPEGVFLGTDGSERWDVAAFRAYAHPHFAAGRGWTYR